MFELRLARSVSILVIALVLSAGRKCRAEAPVTSTASDRVTSQVLFERGRSLFIEGRFDEACPMLEESQRLAPGVGVLLHLGACFERLGKTASAWATFQEAADRSRAEGDLERESMAQARATALRSKLAYLTLRLRQAGSTEGATPTSLPGWVQVSRDGNVVSAATLGLEEPIDPGPHNIVVRAAGMQDAIRDVTLGVGEHSSLDIELVPLPVTPTTRVEPPAYEMPAATARPYPTAETPSARPWIVWTSLGLGTLGLVTGGAAGLVAYTKMQDARSLCDGYSKNQCPQESVHIQEQARLPAGIATASVAVGVGCLAFAGGYWLVTRSGRTVVTASVSPGNALIAVQTRW